VHADVRARGGAEWDAVVPTKHALDTFHLFTEAYRRALLAERAQIGYAVYVNRQSHAAATE